MKVILQTDVKGQGKKGQLVDVSDGYGRNYLLPRKLAVEATAQNLNVMKARDESIKRKAEKDRQDAVAFAEAIKDKTVQVRAKGGQNGKLFGSVTTADIAKAISEQLGQEVDKRKIQAEDIKQFGTYPAEARVHADVTAKFFVLVIEE